MAGIEVSLKREDMEAIADIVVKKMRGTKSVAPVTYTVKEVADITRAHPNTILSHIKQKLIHATRKGRNWLISEDSLNNYMQTNK